MVVCNIFLVSIKFNRSLKRNSVLCMLILIMSITSCTLNWEKTYSTEPPSNSNLKMASLFD